MRERLLTHFLDCKRVISKVVKRKIEKIYTNNEYFFEKIKPTSLQVSRIRLFNFSI